MKLNKTELIEKLTLLEIPGYMHESIVAYILEGRPVGNFLTALFSNDFKEMCNRADEKNQKLFYNYGFFLYNYAPMGCWGSEENHISWLHHQGMKFIYPAVPDTRD